MASASDDFNRTDSASDLGANWTDVEGGGGGIASNRAVSSDGSFCSTFYSGVSFTAAQSSQVLNINASTFAGPGVRMATGSNWYVYFATGEVYRSSGGSTSDIGVETAVGAGETAKITADGSTLEMFINGASQGTLTDATLATGAPGMVFFGTAGALDDWEGADIGGTPPSVGGAIVFNMMIG